VNRYENRLTRLTTLVQVAIGILVMVLASQAGLWNEYGKLSAQVTGISVQLTRISEQIDQVGRTIKP
jgi:hypothetical protein